MPAKTDTPFSEVDEPYFEVTVESVIARVKWSRDGELTPTQAAFIAIANHNSDGVYRFPGPHEDSETVVVVEGIE